MNIMDMFKTVIIVQLFYAFAITMLVYNLPSGMTQYTTSFSDVAGNINLTGVSSQVEGTLQSQMDIPVVDIGALVLFSGNILLDLLANFAFALPQMTTLLINGLMLLINVNANITGTIQIFATVTIMVLYFLGLLSLLTNIRSRGSVI